MTESRKYVREIIIFTDGSFSKRKNIKTGRTDIFCGYGIYFPNKELPNISRPFTLPKKTNQRAELFAIYVALVIINKKLNYDKAIIYSDSEYSIKSLTVWIETWKNNYWKNSKKKPVENLDIIVPLDRILSRNRGKISFVHVRSHTGLTDPLSIGNDIADKLATSGATRMQKIEKMKVSI